MKAGKISSALAGAYEQYVAALAEVFQGPRYRIIRAPSHIVRKTYYYVNQLRFKWFVCNASAQGFAMAVKLGLESIETEYAIVMQHDRKFRKDVGCLDLVGARVQLFTRPFVSAFVTPRAADKCNGIFCAYQIHWLPHLHQQQPPRRDQDKVRARRGAHFLPGRPRAGLCGWWILHSVAAHILVR